MFIISKRAYFNTALLLFVLCLSVSLIKNTTATINVLLAISFILTGYLLSFCNFSRLYKLLVFLIPFSINLSSANINLAVLVPSEPFIGLLAIAFCSYLFFQKAKINIALLKHPITVFILLYLFFIIISVAFSNMPLVSIKAAVVKCAYILVFYFLTHFVVGKNSTKMPDIFIIYGMALIPVIIFTLINHSSYGFSKDTSNIVSAPFFSDHTIYSACLTFVILPLSLLLLFSKTFQLSSTKKIFLLVLVLLLLIGIGFSYCRAAWLSLVSGVIFLVVLYLRVNIKGFIALFLISGTIIFFLYPQIIEEIKQNKNDSNAKRSDILQQTKSITNITNDKSNAERLNRWSCAIRMFKDKPYVGFGIGTYQFEYLSYQRKKEMTMISVTSPYNIRHGHGGSAHSEYLLTLSESGIFAFISFLSVVLAAFYYGIKIVSQSTALKTKILVSMPLSALITYCTHALFNNFLDIDKAAFLFWSSISMISSVSISQKKSIKFISG
jgi:putative inorganic carbon (HCO3(-)) transporter